MSSAAIAIDVDIADDILLDDFPVLETITSSLDTLCQSISTQLALESDAECTLRFVSSEESAFLNGTYRQKDKPTNVLSFPAELPDFIESDFIGDIAVCLDVVKSEAEAQQKVFLNHLLHIISHGILHLLGYDHITEEMAVEMETQEKLVLAQLGIDDPYQVQ